MNCLHETRKYFLPLLGTWLNSKLFFPLFLLLFYSFSFFFVGKINNFLIGIVCGNSFYSFSHIRKIYFSDVIIFVEIIFSLIENKKKKRFFFITFEENFFCISDCEKISLRTKQTTLEFFLSFLSTLWALYHLQFFFAFFWRLFSCACYDWKPACWGEMKISSGSFVCFL